MIALIFRNEISPLRSGSSKDPLKKYRKPQTHPKASLRWKGLGAGRNFTSKVSKSNTLPIQISLTLVETLVGTTSVGLWFWSFSQDTITRSTLSLTHHDILPPPNHSIPDKEVMIFQHQEQGERISGGKMSYFSFFYILYQLLPVHFPVHTTDVDCGPNSTASKTSAKKGHIFYYEHGFVNGIQFFYQITIMMVCWWC